MRLVIQIILWIVIIFLGYKLYSSISGPYNFNKEKEVRYQKVINNLKDIRDAELAYQEIVGGFTGSFDSLVRFLDTAQFAITQRRDSVYADVEKNKAYGIDEGYFITETLIDTLSFTPVKDSLYGSTDRYKEMMNVPIKGVDAQFDLEAGTITKNGSVYSVFQASVPKEVVLQGMDEDLIYQEKQANTVDGVRGAKVQVGSMDEIDTNGNWGKSYDSGKKL
ncbi:hypothetical protein INR76_11235 [Marixanthomonas sp. SCSIO 43207]|uniref:hypothetical protein n=1 Tax=Marixanthomonas sp. SCSIO 43207 TaxID=2779360 RepID=UPI001CAA0C25|nr:hypothetical protein [Marixanthomonas sp. SCSIO 43207]UAB80677.1 hypothetical protein INR76_11235 [Marixanthomonas sp. SCSIO 43207]